MTELEKTIAAQAHVLEDVMALDIEPLASALGPAERIWLVGTGTSQHAAELGARMLTEAGLNAAWSSAAAFARSPDPGSGDAVIVVTHTGETAFARAAREQSIEAGVVLISLTGSGVPWPDALWVAPREKSETYSASYTAVLFTLARLAGALGVDAFGPDALAATLRAVGDASVPSASPVAELPARMLTITGSGPGAITAREGALKVREAAQVLCEGYEAEYLLHGSAVPLGSDDALLLLEPERDQDGLLGAIGEAARATGVAVTELSTPGLGHPLLDQLPLTASLQSLAAAYSRERGTDPDRVITGPWDSDRLWGLGGP